MIWRYDPETGDIYAGEVRIAAVRYLAPIRERMAETNANGRLLAAAPGLLAALRDMLENGYSREKARAAIAAATGEEP